MNRLQTSHGLNGLYNILKDVKINFAIKCVIF